MDGRDTSVKVLAFMGACVGFPVAVAALSSWRGYVLSILWGWFMVAGYGLPALSIPVAIGLSLIVGHLCHDFTLQRKERKWYETFALSAFLPLISLGIGWVVKHFV